MTSQWDIDKKTLFTLYDDIRKECLLEINPKNFDGLNHIFNIHNVALDSSHIRCACGEHIFDLTSGKLYDFQKDSRTIRKTTWSVFVIDLNTKTRTFMRQYKPSYHALDWNLHPECTNEKIKYLFYLRSQVMDIKDKYH